MTVETSRVETKYSKKRRNVSSGTDVGSKSGCPPIDEAGFDQQ
jgi:hypothetical protein